MTLHSLACHGWAECRCAVVYRVRETGTGSRARAYDGEYHGEVGHTLESPTVPVSCSPRRRGRSRSIEVSR